MAGAGAKNFLDGGAGTLTLVSGSTEIVCGASELYK